MRSRGAYNVMLLAAAALLTGCNGLSRAPGPADPLQAAIDARWTLQEAVQASEPFTRSQAIEALAQTVGEDAGPVYVKALRDEDPAVRFAAAMAIGDIRHAPAKDALQELAEVHEGGEVDKRVFCGIVYALHRLADDTYTGQLGVLLLDPAREVRANAALVMGKMGLEAAIEPLKRLESDERDRDGLVRLNALEALAKLGDRRSIGILESFTRWYDLDFRLVAIQALGHVPSPRSKLALRSLLSDRLPRVRVAAADALARLGDVDDGAYRMCVEAVTEPRKLLERAYRFGRAIEDVEVASLQQLGARALGEMNRVSAVDVLAPLLRSRQGSVRVAAAMGILRLLRDRLPRPAGG